MVGRLLGRVVPVTGALLLLGIGGGFAAGAMLDGGPVTTSTADPVVAVSPSTPVQTLAPYAEDLDYPTLRTGLRYTGQDIGDGDFTWRYAAPKGWVARPIGAGEVRWIPEGSPDDGGFAMRVKLVSERKTPADMVAQKLAVLTSNDQTLDVMEVGRTSDSLAFTYRTAQSNRLRYNTFRWFSRDRDPASAAEFEVSVVGRKVDVPGLSDLLTQISASVRFTGP